MKIIEHPSPNYDERRLPVSMIVVHYTETVDCEQALRILCDPALSHPVSSHWVIDRDGTVYRLVDESKRAWHAGVSFWDGITDCNSASIGIELVNNGSEEYPTPPTCRRPSTVEISSSQIVLPPVRKCRTSSTSSRPRRIRWTSSRAMTMSCAA